MEISPNSYRKLSQLGNALGLSAALVAVFSAPVLSADVPVLHCLQQHRLLGHGELFLNESFGLMRWTSGDAIAVWHRDKHKVFIFNPKAKLVVVQSESQYYKHGFSLTGGSLASSRDAEVTFRRDVTLLKTKAKFFEILCKGVSRAGKPFLVKCGRMIYMTGMPSKFANDFVSLTYGIPQNGNVPLEMKLDYRSDDSDGWFQTSAKALDKKNEDPGYFRLQTTKIERIKVNADLFKLPPGLKQITSQEKFFGSTETARDLSDLLLSK
ncbi:MAG: hypothetical protein IAF58_05030 [Leptolyngbya sp.]|nr:hypothetical protein [Candidatus Melainabacteria bacterium]